jgi:hypothetical protein
MTTHPKIGGSPAALHSKASPKWGTPATIATRARVALGGSIDLDPATSERFNTVIQASRILTEQDNGLVAEWRATDPFGLLKYDPISVFLNPPGGLVRDFWKRLIHELAAGVVSRAIWIGFSVEQLCILQDEELYPLDFSSVILRKRLAFTKEDGESGGSPSHGNYITGLNINGEIFSTLFGDLGRVIHGAAALHS